MYKIYASYFVAYLLSRIKSRENIQNIILFGSAAKEEATKESDIDIFIEVKKKTKQQEKEIENIVKEFYKSREAILFKTRGIDNKINILIGKLEEWRELKESIESTGIILYGKYIPSSVKGKKYAIIFWHKIEKNRGAFLNKIYGFKVKDKVYKGLLELDKGSKIGKSAIIIPIEYREEIMKVLKDYRVHAEILEVYK